MHRGVYAVGHTAMRIEGRWMAATLACGPAAVLSHADAAALHGLRQSTRAVIDVTSPTRAGRSRPGIEVHAGRTLAPADRTIVRGIPCTSLARTLLDEAEVLGRRGLERICEEAEIRRIFDLRAVDDVLGRADGRHGAPVLDAVLADHRFGDTLTRNELEERFLALCESGGLPKPRVNADMLLDADVIEVDFMWPEHGLIAETDGYRTHGTRTAFERDRERDRRLLLAGWRVVRFTWRQVIEEPAAVVGALQVLIARP